MQAAFGLEHLTQLSLSTNRMLPPESYPQLLGAASRPSLRALRLSFDVGALLRGQVLWWALRAPLLT